MYMVKSVLYELIIDYINSNLFFDMEPCNRKYMEWKDVQRDAKFVF